MKKFDQDLDHHTGMGNTLAFKRERPYKIFTGSEDSTVNLFKGPPFKFEKTFRYHKNFVNCVRINPAGTIAASVSSDKKICLMDSSTGDIILEKENCHTGSIYSISWWEDGSKFVTCSADKTVRIWNADDLELLQ